MSEQFGNLPKDFSEFDHMSSEMLEQILRADAQKLDDDSDLDAILYITGLLNERETKNCCPKGKQKRPLVRFVAAVAAVVCLLIASTSIAVAFGFDVRGIIATWTNDVFRFAGTNVRNTNKVPAIPEDQGETDYADLETALIHFGMKNIKEPSVLPEAFALDYFDVLANEVGVTIYAEYLSVDGRDYISVCIRDHKGVPSATYEKTAHEVDVFRVEETVCYAFRNTEHETIVWVTDQYECCVNGTVSRKVLKEVATSMIGS